MWMRMGLRLRLWLWLWMTMWTHCRYRWFYALWLSTFGGLLWLERVSLFRPITWVEDPVYWRNLKQNNIRERFRKGGATFSTWKIVADQSFTQRRKEKQMWTTGPYDTIYFVVYCIVEHSQRENNITTLLDCLNDASCHPGTTNSQTIEPDRNSPFRR